MTPPYAGAVRAGVEPVVAGVQYRGALADQAGFGGGGSTWSVTGMALSLWGSGRAQAASGLPAGTRAEPGTDGGAGRPLAVGPVHMGLAAGSVAMGQAGFLGFR